MNKASNIITIKGQPAAVTFEADINAFRGKFLNVNGYCDFVATSIEALYREGESALDEWMADCEEDGIAPFREEEEQKRLTLRVPHHIDSRLTIVARQHSISKNQLIVDVLEREFSAQINRSDAAWHPTFASSSILPIYKIVSSVNIRRAPKSDPARKVQLTDLPEWFPRCAVTQ